MLHIKLDIFHDFSDLNISFYVTKKKTKQMEQKPI